MFDNLVKALGWSALLHLLVVAGLWYTYQPGPATQSDAQTIQPKAIEAFVYQPPRPTPPLDKADDVMQKDPVMPTLKTEPITALKKKAPTTPVKAEPVAVPEKLVSAPPPVDNTTDQLNAQLNDQPNDHHNQATRATHVTNPTQETHTPMSLAERSLAIASRHHSEISSAAIAAMQQRPDLRDRPATTSKPKLAPNHAAANVLLQLSDGSFIEKVGDYCYLAKPGADLRADIFSMKPVPCGEDKNTAMYERIMSKVGQDR